MNKRYIDTVISNFIKHIKIKKNILNKKEKCNSIFQEILKEFDHKIEKNEEEINKYTKIICSIIDASECNKNAQTHIIKMIEIEKSKYEL